jgi:hypothetical protein
MKIASLIPRTLVAVATAALALSGISNVASAAPSGVGIPSALIIAKSSNRNQVHYSVRVDDSCSPNGPEPVAPYWLMLERGPDVTEPLSDGEERVLGLERQVVTPEGIRISVRALPGRTLTIHTWRSSEGQCASAVSATIGGVSARLASVYVKQKLFGISYVLLTGIGEDGVVVQERVVP